MWQSCDMIATKRLWVAVVVQAMVDIHNPKYAEKVELWLDSKDFELVAEALELEVDSFRKVILSKRLFKSAHLTKGVKSWMRI
jgi:hypothetical protein